jgi:AAA15 family ATPase/GTPase
MLIEFSVTNYRSILERQTLSMAASSYFKEYEELNTFAPALAALQRALRPQRFGQEQLDSGAAICQKSGA